jgi:RNA polymerase sigma factor (sigma-70 family)
MGTGRLKKVLGHLRQALLPPDGGGLTDGQLLARFVAGREEAAFAALVRRHGPMVLGVCRRILGHAHDAEDAFQATFLVLARKAGSVVKREALASFLYGVAYRTALRAKQRAVRRRATERQVEDMPHPEVAPPEAQDWRPVLDRELERLPEKYRVAVILCDLEGKTRREAARQRGLSEGTLSSHLTRARRLLARRLARQGVTLSGGALAAALAEGASAAVPAELASATVKAAVLVAAGVATPAAALMNEVLKAMLMTKLKLATTGLVAVVLLGAGGVAYRAAGQAAPTGGPEGPKPRTEVEALRHENELLKLNLEVVLEKVRAQEAELKAFRGRAAAAAKVKGEDLTAITDATRQAYVNATSDAYINLLQARRAMEGQPAALNQAPPDPVKEVEAALEALRKAPGSGKERQRAAEALERALKLLREPTTPSNKLAPK